MLWMSKSSIIEPQKSYKIPYCVIYCEPLITLDFDCVVAVEGIERLKEILKERGFKTKTDLYTYEVTHRGSDVRIQIQRDKRYQGFIERAEEHKVLGYKINVAKDTERASVKTPSLIS
jgi:hypothetical protein